MKKVALAIGAMALPLVSFAQELSGIETLILSIGRIVNLAIPIVFALALLVFFWGLVKYIWGGAEDKDKAKNLMIWGVVALFVMAAIWGLVAWLGSTLNIDQEAAPVVNPLIPGSQG